MAMVRRSHRQGPEGNHARRHRQIHQPPRRLRQHHQGRRALRRPPGRGTSTSSGSTRPRSTAATSPSDWTDVTASSSPAGSASAAPKAKIECIRYARETRMPYLGLCLGFQMAVIEYARNVCGIPDANSTEFEPRCSDAGHRHPARAEENRRPRRQHAPRRQRRRPQTRHARRPALFDNANRIRLRFRHRYEVDPKYIPTLEEHGMIFSGKAPRPADHADPGTATGRASVFRRHAGPSRADQPAAPALAAVSRLCESGD